ncbi:hypothetical protein TcYC6_0049270 [Trypanosoma cruzi]|nr:hypothetical protein TcYC6_0049270 [Trypanosoma cruzi]
MAVEMRHRLQAIARYMEEGEALFHGAVAHAHDEYDGDDATALLDSRPSTGKTELASPSTSSRVPRVFRMTPELRNALRTGLEAHKSAERVLQEASMNPIFTFATMRC